MNKKLDTKRLVLLAVLTAILLVMSFTPLGYLNIGPLAITLNMIPVAIGAVALGPSGGAFLGAVFGVTSCLQCIGIGGVSAMGVALFEINPVLTLLHRFVPRLLAGWIAGWIYVGMNKISYTKVGKAMSGTTNTLIHTVSGFVTGFSAALLNTVLFMASLIMLFGNTEYLQNMIDAKVPVEIIASLELWFGNMAFLPDFIIPYFTHICIIAVFVCVFVGINAVVEMLASTIVVGAVTASLKAAHMIGGK